MPNRPHAPCTTPGCPNTTDTGRCPTCQTRRTRATDQARGTPAQRGYDRRWSTRRLNYLADRPACTLCGAPANVADHWPLSRRQLLDQGDPDPDAPHHLRPLCDHCHHTATAHNQPGGWAREKRRPQ